MSFWIQFLLYLVARRDYRLSPLAVGVCACGLALRDVVVAALAHAHGPQRAQAAHGRLVARAAPAEHRAALAAVVAPL